MAWRLIGEKPLSDEPMLTSFTDAYTMYVALGGNEYYGYNFHFVVFPLYWYQLILLLPFSITSLAQEHIDWNFVWNSNIFIQENAFEIGVCKMWAILFRPKCTIIIYLWPQPQ